VAGVSIFCQKSRDKVPQSTYLKENHGGNLLGREGLGLAEVLDLDHGCTTLVGDLEGPGLDILLDGDIVESATDETPGEIRVSFVVLVSPACTMMRAAYLTSKTVFSGFMAAWFLAASPIKRSSAVKETNEGVVKLPCSLATVGAG